MAWVDDIGGMVWWLRGETSVKHIGSEHLLLCLNPWSCLRPLYKTSLRWWWGRQTVGAFFLDGWGIRQSGPLSAWRQKGPKATKWMNFTLNVSLAASKDDRGDGANVNWLANSETNCVFPSMYVGHYRIGKRQFLYQRNYTQSTSGGVYTLNLIILPCKIEALCRSMQLWQKKLTLRKPNRYMPDFPSRVWSKISNQLFSELQMSCIQTAAIPSFPLRYITTALMEVWTV